MTHLAWLRPTTEKVISFERGEFEARPAELLEPLVNAGIIYAEGDWFLSLPVARGSPPLVRWQILAPVE
jgi:hypothetical protein